MNDRRWRHLVIVCALAGVSAGGAAQSDDAGTARETLARAADLLSRNKTAEVIALVEPIVRDGHAPADAAGGLQFTLAEAYYRSARYAEALSHYEDALAAQHAAGDRAAEARTLRGIAQLHKNQGAYEAGLNAGARAFELYRSLGSTRDAALTSIVLGAIHESAGDHTAALKAYELALPVFADERSGNAANLMGELGVTYKNLGRYAEAARWYERGIGVAAALHDLDRQAMLSGNLAILYTTIGDDDRAVDYGQRALALARQAGNRRFEMLGLLNLANTYWSLGDRRRALDMVRQDLAVAESLGTRSELATLRKNLGDIETTLGNYAEGSRQYDAALDIRRAIGDGDGEAAVRIAMADLARKSGRPGDSLALAEAAVSLSAGSGRLELEWQARRAVAAAAVDMGQPARALDELRASTRIVNTLRANVPGDANRIAFVDRRESVFDDFATLLARTGSAAAALEAAEAGRARAFADLLAQRQLFGPAAPPGARNSPSARSSVSRDQPSGEGFRSTTSAAPPPVSTASVELESLLTAQSPTAADIAQTASRLGAVIVEYLVGEQTSFAWVVQPDGNIRVAQLDARRERLDTLTRTVRSSIESSDRSAQRARTIDPALRELDRILIQPIETWLPVNPDAPVIVVPHGALALLPFAALTDGAGRTLLDRHTLAFAPTASVYAYTRDKKGAASNRGALVIADPLPPSESGAARLLWARTEGRQIASHLQRDGVRLLTGGAATEAAVKHDAGRYRIVHFATHGLIAPEQPFASSLLLSAGDGEDGYLRVDEIFRLDLHADLVVLSGCSTGLGKLTGDGILGLTRAFLYAGTPTVVVSAWIVGDRATARLMDAFYAQMQRGLAPASALRTAARAMRQQGADVSSWAAFQVVGEP